MRREERTRRASIGVAAALVVMGALALALAGCGGATGGGGDLMSIAADRGISPEDAATRLDALYREGFVGESVRTHLLVTVPRSERHFQPGTSS